LRIAPPFSPTIGNTFCVGNAIHFEVSEYLCLVMTFYEKYPQLKEKTFLIQILTETVFTTMSLEDQQVPKDRVQEIVLSVLANEELERSKFNGNQTS
jgi:hypothetical protein